MGTCIGHRNIRYFVCFLLYTSLHGLITGLIGFLYFWFVTREKYDTFFDSADEKEARKEDPDYEEPTSYVSTMQIVNGAAMVYGFAFFLMLFCFGLSMHY